MCGLDLRPRRGGFEHPEPEVPDHRRATPALCHEALGAAGAPEPAGPGGAVEECSLSEIKVTDKRMFTPDGKLRHEYEELAATATAEAAAESRQPGREPDTESGGKPDAAREPAPPPPRQAAPESASPPPADGREEPAGRPRVELPDEPSAYGAPGILDLVAMLAEPVAIYLGDAPMPDGKSVENLDLARMHIDLLEVLVEKTSGNLTSQETAIVDDLLYRLRMRYVEKRG